MKTLYISYDGDISADNNIKFINCVEFHLKHGFARIYLMISSYGGDLSAGIRLYYYLKKLPAKVEVVTHNTGYIKSAANTVFMAGSPRYAVDVSFFWFHDVLMEVEKGHELTFGEARDLFLEMGQIREISTNIYRTRTKAGERDLELFNNRQKFVGAEQAKKLAIVHGIEDTPEAMHSAAFFGLDTNWTVDSLLKSVSVKGDVHILLDLD